MTIYVHIDSDTMTEILTLTSGVLMLLLAAEVAAWQEHGATATAAAAAKNTGQRPAASLEGKRASRTYTREVDWGYRRVRERG